MRAEDDEARDENLFVRDKQSFRPGILKNYFFLEDFFFAPFFLAATVYHPQSDLSFHEKS